MQAKRFVNKSVAIFALVVSGLWVQATWADTSTIKLLVGFPPGGATDAIARLITDKLPNLLGQPVVIENRPGVGGRIAAEAENKPKVPTMLHFGDQDQSIPMSDVEQVKAARSVSPISRSPPAIAATFADVGIDKDPLVRIRKMSALAAAALFCSTGLDVNYSRHTLVFAEFFLNFG